MPAISQIIEKTVFKQIGNFLAVNNYLDIFHSGFRPHSIKTALFKCLNQMNICINPGKVSVLMFIGCTAFDTVDHNTVEKKS